MRKDTDKCQLIEGELTAGGLRFAIIVSRFNSFITEASCSAELSMPSNGWARPADSIKVVKVPGSLEIPVVAKELGKKRRLRRDHLPRCGDPWGKRLTSTTSRRRARKGVATASLETGVPYDLWDPDLQHA